MISYYFELDPIGIFSSRTCLGTLLNVMHKRFVCVDFDVHVGHFDEE